MANQSLKIQNAAWPLVLGLDIGSQSLKYVLLRHKGQKIQLVKFGRHNLPLSHEGTPVFEKRLLFQIFGSAVPSKGIKVVVGLEGQGVATKHATFPSLPKKELMQTISYELQQEMGLDEDDGSLIYDYKKLGSSVENPNLIDYITLGTSQENIELAIQPLVEQSVIPAKVLPNVVALGNLMPLIPDLQSYQNVAILDLGSKRSVLIIMRHGKLFFFRDILVGAEDFTRAITGTIFHEGKAIQFNPDEAQEFKSKFGYPIGFSEGMMFKGAPLSEIGAMMRPVIERLTGEIQRSLDFYSEKVEDEKVEALYLLGGGARLKNLSEILYERVEIPVAPLPLPEYIKFQAGKRQKSAFSHRFLEQAVSLSLAMETLPDCNLLPQHYLKIQKFQNIQNIVRIASFGVAMIMMVLTLFIQTNFRSLKDEVGRLERRSKNLKNTGREYALLNTQKNLLETQNAAVQQKLVYNDDSIQILKIVSNVIPENLPLISVEYGQEKVNPNIRRGRGEPEAKPQWVLKIKGASMSPRNDVRIYVGKFIMELKKSGYFADVDLTNELYDTEINHYAFELSAVVKKD